MRTIIGFTGSFGSGCTYIAKEFIEKMGYKYISLSQILRDIYSEENNGAKCEFNRHDMQEYGNNIRKTRHSDYLAVRASKIIEKDGSKNWVIDGIRNPKEAKFLNSKYGRFYLIAVFADYETRWQRIKANYNDDERFFHLDDERDSNESIEYGQRVRDCYNMADYIVSNNKSFEPKSKYYYTLKAKIDKFIRLINGEITFEPSEREAIMSMAYANSLRSSCLKRKVGSVIVDMYGNIFSSGYNEVPVDHTKCEEEWGTCYRDFLRNNFSSEIKKAISDTKLQETVISLFQQNFKILDYCRSLHAEENAILNVARFGSSTALRGATIYTTTYPCNLCANKIVQVGISSIVYLEPYPMQEAKKILSDNKVTQEPFEGITFNGYFRFLEV
ncbi:MAG: deaminase [Lutisporaceae bacterium]|jgi:deoxycytidylate deaminase